MKKIFFTLASVPAAIAVIAAHSISIENNTLPVQEYNLPEKKSTAWNTVKDDWMTNVYRPCLKRYKLRMTCSGCVYIYIKAEMTIDTGGKLKQYNKTGSNVCGRKITPALEKCFMRHFEEKSYAEELKDSVFETMLGTGLKC